MSILRIANHLHRGNRPKRRFLVQNTKKAFVALFSSFLVSYCIVKVCIAKFSISGLLCINISSIFALVIITDTRIENSTPRGASDLQSVVFALAKIRRVCLPLYLHRIPTQPNSIIQKGPKGVDPSSTSHATHAAITAHCDEDRASSPLQIRRPVFITIHRVPSQLFPRLGPLLVFRFDLPFPPESPSLALKAFMDTHNVHTQDYRQDEDDTPHPPGGVTGYRMSLVEEPTDLAAVPAVQYDHPGTLQRTGPILVL